MHKATNTKLKIGQINFINCLPIDYPMSKVALQAYEYYSASPSELNAALREGEISLAPISSYEYLSHKDLYDLIPGVSISSKTVADSVLFLFRGKLEDKKKIYLTDKSASSVNLLKLLLVKKYKLKLDAIEFVTFSTDSEDYEAKLLIGDEALKANKQGYTEVLDLGKEWFELTNLPMVFGLWTASKKLGFTETELNKLGNFFSEMRDKGLNEYFPDIIIEAFKKTGLPKSTLTQYFNNLDYSFTEKHRASLELFELMLVKENLL